MAQNTLESFLNAENGDLSLQMQGGEQCFIRPAPEGKVKFVDNVNGEVKFNSNWITPVDPKDPEVIEIAKHAANKNPVVFESIIRGVKINALFTTAYCLTISAKVSSGAKNLYLAVVVGSYVLLFEYVMPVPS